MERLCDDLWAGRPPSSAVSSLHAHVSRLRSVLEGSRDGRNPTRILVSTTGGYALRLAPDQRDTVQFERAVGRARHLAGKGMGAQARREVERALGMWRGEPCVEAHGLLFAQRESDRLVELRCSAQDLRARLLLDEGRVAEALAVAEALVSADELRETAWVTLLRALYAAGRTAEALQRYEAVRRMLADSLGTDPSPELRRVHLSILQHDTGVLAPRVGGRVSPVVVGAGRSSDVLPMEGRGAELGVLLDVLASAREGRTGWAVVSGEAGVGKTRLIRELAAHAEEAGFDVVWTRYPKRTGPGSRTQGAGEVLRVLDGLRPLPVPVPVVGPRRGQSAGRPVLCLVDDVQGAPAVEVEELAVHAETLHGAAVAVVCTTPAAAARTTDELRARLARSGAEHVELGPLDTHDVELLLRAADDDAHEGPVAASDLHRWTGGNPFYLTEILRLPADRRGPSGHDVPVPPAVASEVRARLAVPGPECRRLLETAAVFGDRIDIPFLAGLCALRIEQVLGALDDAVEAGLVEWTPGSTPLGPGEYAFTCGLVRSVLLSTLSPSR
ncbi:BTAD domain-containing putative transcriptional regulator, partial [Streptomyces sp. NPDC060022]|uniref:BTAD domain-containing putative transcriptional regulator n=1 Tax=Streptomyces sp. NPDC060022 TaxID=3347039 RepID=UPI003678F78C